ncbi:chemotaxis-specific protein-glutamate methyltransferase CheB [Natrononativus amylolyticus]|uniref:chemotaxis-specific protein-glutamate methyltransferase CheB n=1 Tax=Natrononativus amylolyticus TaxID=2963434 RepID=UPI0020CF7EB3|nr:chemotaxis-specific protein-glutamate methyltransferase CheB [Natrononativus amylolyticus]
MTCVLVVDDSQFVRTVVGNALATAGYRVETAADGREAVAAADRYEPAVITMDVEMPGLGGIDAVERIMSTTPTAILMLSAHTERGADATLEALERGAVSFVHKPDGSDSRNLAHLTEAVVEAVDELVAADVSSLALARAAAAVHSTGPNRHRRVAVAGGSASQREPDATARGRGASTSRAVDVDAGEPTVVVGASTGGPKIVEGLLAGLPAALDATVLVVQHMPAGFTGRFASRLDEISEYDVREARDGDRIDAGEALVAPGGYHLEVAASVGGRVRVRLDDGERRHGVRPAIDVTMQTAAERVSGPLCGVVLSGMGRDGAAGIEAIAAADGVTVAQDEATSPVFGIPAKAIETGCVDAVVPAERLADELVDALTTNGENDD